MFMVLTVGHLVQSPHSPLIFQISRAFYDITVFISGKGRRSSPPSLRVSQNISRAKSTLSQIIGPEFFLVNIISPYSRSLHIMYYESENPHLIEITTMLIFSGFQVQVAVTLSRDILTVDPPLTRPHHFTVRHSTT
jgi:hypothetical protein